MLRVEHDGANWVFVANYLEGEPRLHFACLEGAAWPSGFLFVATDTVELGNGVCLTSFEDLRDPTTNIRYELTPIEKKPGKNLRLTGWDDGKIYFYADEVEHCVSDEPELFAQIVALCQRHYEEEQE